MFKKIALLFAVCLSTFALFAASPPDPFLFSTKLLQTLKQNDREFYIRSFEITGGDLAVLITNALTNPYMSDRERERMQEDMLNKENISERIKGQLDRNFTIIQEWAARDTINLAAIEFVDFYFELELKRNTPFYVIDNGSLFVKHGAKFYKLSVEDAAFINGQWKYGEIDGIHEVDSKLNYIDEYDDYVYDAVDTAAVAYDTTVAYDTAAVEPYYEDPYYYPDLSEKQSKKMNKIQKKIDALNEKKEKIYESVY